MRTYYCCQSIDFADYPSAKTLLKGLKQKNEYKRDFSVIRNWDALFNSLNKQHSDDANVSAQILKDLLQAITESLSSAKLIFLVVDSGTLTSMKKFVEENFQPNRILNMARFLSKKDATNSSSNSKLTTEAPDQELKIPKITWDDVGGLTEAKT